jgi:hypothetical protein
VSDAVRDKLPKRGFLFLFAQDAASQNNIPAAVVKVPLTEFPMSLSLTNENAMMTNFSLNQLREARIIARISIDESVDVLPGEFQGEITENVVKNQIINTQITITQELQ